MRAASPHADCALLGDAAVFAHYYLGNDRLHGHVDTEGLFDLTDEIEWGWDITVA